MPSLLCREDDEPMVTAEGREQDCPNGGCQGCRDYAAPVQTKGREQVFETPCVCGEGMDVHWYEHEQNCPSFITEGTTPKGREQAPVVIHGRSYSPGPDGRWYDDEGGSFTQWQVESYRGREQACAFCGQPEQGHGQVGALGHAWTGREQATVRCANCPHAAPAHSVSGCGLCSCTRWQPVSAPAREQTSHSHPAGPAASGS